jgi:magnesium-transporting ATPase (P-type)
MFNIDGKITCELPNAAIYNFEGIMNVGDQTYSLECENLLLRGMSVKNTEYCYGMVVFTGHETKVMKNSEPAKYKQSRLEIAANKTIIMIFGIQILMALVFGILSYFVRKGVWDYSGSDLCIEEATAACAAKKDLALEICLEENTNLCRDHYYLGEKESPSFVMALKSTGTWILFMTNLVPISLIVSLELVKFF